jgi:hypothetical protein
MELRVDVSQQRRPAGVSNRAAWVVWPAGPGMWGRNRVDRPKGRQTAERSGWESISSTCVWPVTSLCVVQFWWVPDRPQRSTAYSSLPTWVGTSLIRRSWAIGAGVHSDIEQEGLFGSLSSDRAVRSSRRNDNGAGRTDVRGTKQIAISSFPLELPGIDFFSYPTTIKFQPRLAFVVWDWGGRVVVKARDNKGWDPQSDITARTIPFVSDF